MCLPKKRVPRGPFFCLQVSQKKRAQKKGGDFFIENTSVRFIYSELMSLFDKVASAIVTEYPDVKNLNLEQALISDLLGCVECIAVAALSNLSII
jgi:hypothetical protein